MADCKAKVVLTASAGMRGKKPIPLKQIVDKGLAQAAKLGAQVCPPRACTMSSSVWQKVMCPVQSASA